VCAHEAVAVIDNELVRGVKLATLAKRYGLTEPSVGRHKKAHVSPSLKAVRTQRATKAATTALAEAEAALADVKRRLAGSGANFGQAMVAHRELRGHLTLYAKLSGELDERPQTTVNIATTDEWVRTRTAVLLALIPYPDAARAVGDALAREGKA
jgi:hypothetical protein